MDDIVKKALEQKYCYLDGEIMKDEFLKVACLKLESGPTISIQ